MAFVEFFKQQNEAIYKFLTLFPVDDFKSDISDPFEWFNEYIKHITSNPIKSVQRGVSNLILILSRRIEDNNPNDFTIGDDLELVLDDTDMTPDMILYHSQSKVIQLLTKYNLDTIFTYDDYVSNPTLISSFVSIREMERNAISHKALTFARNLMETSENFMTYVHDPKPYNDQYALLNQCTPAYITQCESYIPGPM